MAEQIGIIRLSGNIGGLCFYQRNGKTLVRKPSSLTKQRFKRDATFKRSRESAHEFGWSAKLGKTVRSYWKTLKPFMDGKMYLRLQQCFYQIMRQGNGHRGKRALDLLAHKNDLLGFRFTQAYGLHDFLSFKMVIQAISAGTGLQLICSEFALPKSLATATHVRLHFSLLGLDVFEFNDEKEAYLASDADLVGSYSHTHASYLDLNDLPDTLPLSCSLEVASSSVSTGFMVGVVCIEFFELMNGFYYGLQEGKTGEVCFVGC